MVHEVEDVGPERPYMSSNRRYGDLIAKPLARAFSVFLPGLELAHRLHDQSAVLLDTVLGVQEIGCQRIRPQPNMEVAVRLAPDAGNDALNSNARAEHVEAL
jgi:hypothetical protein